MRRYFIAVLLFVVALSGPALAEKRVALVIGNSAYRNVTPLDNPKSDAALMADTLRGLGFSLTGNGAQTDLDKAALDQAIQDFGRQIQGADVAMFYYAGHGVQVRGSNFLVPVNANPTREADVDFQMVDVNLVLNQMTGSGTRLNLLILDACRNNPFGGRGVRSSDGGLAQLRAPEGTLISYATQPGNVAQDGNDGHSPYTKALSVTMKRAGLDVFQTFNEVGLAVKRATGSSQQPWVSSSPIDGEFYFTPKDSSAASAPQDKPPSAPPPSAPAPRQEARLTQPSQSLSPDVVTDCDRLAGNPADPLHSRSVAGVRLNQIDIVPALAACNAAMKQYPDAIRFSYQTGRIVFMQKDYELARQLFAKAADAGYPASYLNLGQLYYQGNGVPKDYVEARKWYDKAVAANDPAAMGALGALFEQGTGAPRDPAEARKWYQKGAELGAPNAMVGFGRMLRDGAGGPIDPAQAKTWFEKAAAAGEPAGMNALGFLYERGIGVPKDPVLEKKWYERAAALGDSNSMNGLGWMYESGNGVPKDYAEAKKWYEKAAALNHYLAMSNLGNLYRDGHGVAQDFVQARAWYEKSAAGGRTFPMMQLGNIYAQGLGVPKDPVQARKWYDMASAGGDATAPGAISRLDADIKNAQSKSKK